MKGRSLYHQLPQTLWCLVQATLVFAQTQQSLSLNSVSTFSGATLSGTPAFTLPSASPLYVSVALCAPGSSARFFVTNSTTAIPSSAGGKDVFEIDLGDGYGNWTGPAPEGGTLAVEDVGQTVFEIGVSSSGVMHQVLNDLPLLGDTTSNQAILFSAPFAPQPKYQPTYPNYTLPSANLSPPSPPSASPNFTLVIGPPSSSLTTRPQTACSLRSASLTGTQISNELWLRDTDGWRSQWLMGGLAPVTNYTAYVIQDQTKVSGPINFVTKSASFSCPLIHSLPYCPTTAYAVPLLALSPAYDSTTLPDQISAPLLQYMTNFTTMLTTFACGRDLYSPLQTCADCQREYRRWLCSISFPRCSEPAPASQSPSTDTQAQIPLPALAPPSNRNPFLPTVNYTYTTLLPCLETCNAVDRACPNFLGIKCPVPQFNAAASYGVGFVDSGEPDVFGNGMTGAAQDRWGNVWCNAF
ncbi:stretch-activated Ca2+-permeable channel component-domain-containing protein [Hygrophoropsis aurantiaca]|uniref:Stretch-activated Ca2+-permeable channel component-domain-containing protein n=1 Tax=Hygrophoropsis aurantiaca TaxID=72124 RepID=A0ACB8A6Y9_9AGAM|nr:stretch-activated Ca2+-permeable channel component-domain-containing protein [Hygrophoropsis aurantiaca]